MPKENILSVYLSHDASASYIDKTGNLKVLEYERFVKQRYGSFTRTMSAREGLGTTDEQRRSFLEYIKADLKGEIDTILTSDPHMHDGELFDEIFPNVEYKTMLHHDAHAASGYYTSDLDEALIFSFDGGGYDLNNSITYTKGYIGVGGKITEIGSYNRSLGIPYGHLAKCISEIKAGPDCVDNSLVYSGKIMGLCGYGNVIEEWVEPINRFYNNDSHHYAGDYGALNRLGEEIGVDLKLNSVEGRVGYDLAATSQHVFEVLTLQLIERFINTPDIAALKEKNVILVGGCALNVLFNQRLSKILNNLGYKVFVPPYPNDCGLSLGQFLWHTRERVESNPYIGFDILDRDKLDTYVESRKAKKCSVKKLVDLIKDGKIIGIVQGQSEIGPRALGNRSIICDPSIKDMKDILNAKVKFREWYRPFAPVCTMEDSDKYFDDVFESRFMSYAPSVKEEYRDVLPSITHVDGTARLQTVDKNGHKLFYSILTELKRRKEIPVILNTSFNMRGYPILTTIEDALAVLDTTEMDHVYVEGYLFSK